MIHDQNAFKVTPTKFVFYYFKSGFSRIELFAANNYSNVRRLLNKIVVRNR